MLQTPLLLMKSFNKTETSIFLSVVCSLFPKAIFLTLSHCPPEDALDPLLPTEDWSDCADAQADLRLRCPHMQACRK